MNVAASVGAKRAISDFQFASSDAGSTSSDGLPPPRFFSADSSASTWIVLPSPMSSARQAPSPRLDRNHSQLTPVSWYGRKVAFRSSPGWACCEVLRDCAGRPALAQPLARRGRTTTARSASRVAVVGQVLGRAGQQPHAFDEREPVARPALRPSSSGPALRSFSRSTSTHWPRSSTSPSSAASSSRHSASAEFLVAQGQLHLEVEHRRGRRTSSAASRRWSRPPADAAASSTSRAAAPARRSPRRPARP